MSLLFFFFKQKTAYEMRISDWSSDVCSSDLRDIAARSPNHRNPEDQDGQPPSFGATETETSLRKRQSPKIAQPLGEDTERPLENDHEIGRASCRERVCQYV